MNRRMILVFLIVAAVALLIAAGAVAENDVPNQESPSFPYEYLSENAIRLATVQILPRNVLVNLNDDEIKELVAILRTVEADNRDDSHSEYGGESVIFTMMLADGTVATIAAFNPFIIMDGIGYRNEACYELSEFGHAVARSASNTPHESAILQLLEKTANSVQIHSGSTNGVTVGQVMHIVLDENQSLPARWNPVISDGSLVQLIHDAIDTSGVAINRMPGEGGERHFFYFEAQSAGECTIEMNYVFIRDDEEIIETQVYTIHIVD